MRAEFKNDYHIADTYTSAPRLFVDMNLYQIGRCFCRPDTVVADHLQGDYVELTLATDGVGYSSASGEEVLIETGDVFVSFPGDIHSIRSDEKNPLKYDFISFMPTSPALVSELVYLKHGLRAVSLRIIKNKIIGDLVSSVIAELDAKGFEYEAVISSMLKQLCILLLREFKNTSARNASANSLEKPNEAERLCYRIMNHIDSNLHNMHGLESLTESFSYNYNYLSNLFKKTTGETLASYYKRKRLETAHAMLSQSKVRITDVAISLGYSSVYTFSRAYKATFGISPKEAKQRIRNKSKSITAEAELGHAELAVNASVGVFDFEK